MRKAFDDVREFHQIGGHPAPGAPSCPKPASDTVSYTLAKSAYILNERAEQHAYLAATAVSEADRQMNLRARLMLEEMSETLRAMAQGDVVGLADGLADLSYVTIGTAVAHGIPLPEVWDEVHRSNMNKFWCASCWSTGVDERGATCTVCKGKGRVRIVREGKIVKPPDWRPPNVAHVLQRAKEA